MRTVAAPAPSFLRHVSLPAGAAAFGVIGLLEVFGDDVAVDLQPGISTAIPWVVPTAALVAQSIPIGAVMRPIAGARAE